MPSVDKHRISLKYTNVIPLKGWSYRCHIISWFFLSPPFSCFVFNHECTISHRLEACLLLKQRVQSVLGMNLELWYLNRWTAKKCHFPSLFSKEICIFHLHLHCVQHWFFTLWFMFFSLTLLLHYIVKQILIVMASFNFISFCLAPMKLYF